MINHTSIELERHTVTVRLNDVVQYLLHIGMPYVVILALLTACGSNDQLARSDTTTPSQQPTPDINLYTDKFTDEALKTLEQSAIRMGVYFHDKQSGFTIPVPFLGSGMLVEKTDGIIIGVTAKHGFDLHHSSMNELQKRYPQLINPDIELTGISIAQAGIDFTYTIENGYKIVIVPDPDNLDWALFAIDTRGHQEETQPQWNTVPVDANWISSSPNSILAVRGFPGNRDGIGLTRTLFPIISGNVVVVDLDVSGGWSGAAPVRMIENKIHTVAIVSSFISTLSLEGIENPTFLSPLTKYPEAKQRALDILIPRR